MRTTLFILFICLFSLSIKAQFLPNHLIVLRTGDGLPSVSGTAVPVSLLQFNLLDTNQTASYFLNMPIIPSTQNGMNRALTLGATSVAEGDLSLSQNGQYLILAGYNAAPNTPSVINTNVEGVVAKVNADGIIHTKTSYNRSNVYITGSVRSACSVDGNSFWTTGSSSSSITTLRYIQTDSTNATGIPITAAGSIGTTRSAIIAGNQLYCSANSLGIKIAEVGAGLPMTSGQTVSNLPGLPQGNIEPYGYQFLDMSDVEPGLDVLYIACIGGPTFSDSSGLFKFSKVGGTWVGNGYITGNARAVACLKTCNSFTDIYITRSDSKTTKANALVVFRDASGYNGNLPGNTSLQDTKILAKAEANYSFNGVCFSPGTNLTPLDFYVSANAIACNGGSTLGTVVAFGGIEPYTKTPDNNYTAGSYPFQVTDASGCSVSRNYLFVQPTALKIQKCYLSSRKILGMKASGGTAPYVYTIDAGASYQQPNAQNNTARAYSNKNGGIYTIGVKDANNCVYFETVNTNSLPSCPTAMTQNVLSIELKQIPGQKYIHVNALYDEQVSVQCAIYNLNGQLILSKNLRTNQWTQIDFPFKPGSYSILIKYQDQVATKTFVE